MSANSPQAVSNLVAKRLSAGDLDGVMALYEPNACFVPQTGPALQGAAAIREGFAGFLTMKPKLTMESESVVQADDVAIVYTKWSLSGIGPDGSPITVSGQATDVMRRQANGTWLCVIDNPYGGG